MSKTDGFPHSGIYNKTATAWLLLWSWCFLLTRLRCLIKMWFSLFPWPPCRGPRSGWCACCPRPIDQRHRGLCIEVVCRAVDAISTFVNYLYSVPQIWSIVNWASGSCLREKRKLCGTKGQNLQCCQFYFPLTLLNTIILFGFTGLNTKGESQEETLNDFMLHARV